MGKARAFLLVVSCRPEEYPEIHGLVCIPHYRFLIAEPLPTGGKTRYDTSKSAPLQLMLLDGPAYHLPMRQKRPPYSLPQPWIFFAGIAVLLLSANARVKAQARPVILRRGQVLELQLLEDIDSKTAHLDDKVPLRLTRDLMADGVTVLPQGSLLYGQVTAAHPAGKSCHHGRLKWKLGHIALANGQNVKTQFISDDTAADGKVGDRVSLPSNRHKINKGIESASETALLGAFVVALAPLTIPMAITMPEPCDGRHGEEETIARDRHFFLAVSKTIKITR